MINVKTDNRLFIIISTFMFFVSCLNQDAGKVKNEYDNDGNLVKSIYAEKDKSKECVKHFYKNGNIQKEYCVIHGKIDGKLNAYYQNGMIQSEQNYSMGRHNGKFVWYYENGKIESSVNYSDDIISSVWTHYYEDGSQEAELYYSNNQKYLIKRFDTSGLLEYKSWKPIITLSNDTIIQNQDQQITFCIPKSHYRDFVESPTVRYDLDRKRESDTARYYEPRNSLVLDSTGCNYDILEMDSTGKMLLYGWLEFRDEHGNLKQGEIFNVEFDVTK